MRSTMMADQATVQAIFRRGARIHAGSQVVSYDGAGFRRASFGEVAERAARLAAALRGLGIGAGDRVATLCWNHQPHLEAYFAVPCLGAVLHTLNGRLHPDQLAYMVDELDDALLIADSGLRDVAEALLARSPALRRVVIVGEGAPAAVAGRPAIGYEALLAGAQPLQDWPALDEAAAAVACYTSGTTGHPKGIVYAHRSIFMHSLASMGVDTFAVSERDRVLLLPPMFHANAWGLPYTAWFAGSDLILPGPYLQPAAVRAMIAECRPTFTAMVPTLINDLLAADERQPLDMSSFRVLVSGGSAVAPALIDRVRARWGLPVMQGWGMTETSPICALSGPPRGAGPAEETAWRARSGRPVAGVEVRLCDDAGAELPWDGAAVGELQLRGPWVTGAYHGAASPASFTADGWLRTGDVGSIDPRGFVEVKDRAKDVIKSGGEWISSVELEGRLLAHPAVGEVAVVAIPDPRWEERPLAVVALKPGAQAGPDALQDCLAGKVARFWIPEYWSFVDALPRTSVGKLDKKALREAFNEGRLDVTQQGLAKQRGGERG
jgi:fatty-acyl-CoA synthase